MRLAIIGDGKMGRAVAALAAERGDTVTCVLGMEGNAGGIGITGAGLGDPEVAVEFTEPGAAAGNVIACARAGIPVVVGTTGWYDDLERVSAEVKRHDGAMLWAPNFSIGVALLTAAAAEVAARLRHTAGFDVHLVETHHTAKKDRPSGTALSLAAVVRDRLGRDVPVTSIRTGHVPGIHELVFDAPFEQLRLTHEARDRRVFADGALRAAEWLRGRRGVFTLRDLMAPTETT
jgi:4-hydroxy-tetrahydrodipicolinate reductase